MSSDTLIPIRLNPEARAKLARIAIDRETSINGVLAAAAADLAGVRDEVRRRPSRADTARDPSKVSSLTLRISAPMLAALEARAARDRTTVSSMVRNHALELDA
jgi:hypothetical protein